MTDNILKFPKRNLDVEVDLDQTQEEYEEMVEAIVVMMEMHTAGLIVTSEAKWQHVMDAAMSMAVNAGSTNDSVYDAVDNSTTLVYTTDDDSIGITLNKTTSTITEGGSTDAITARLDAQPTATVRLDVSSSDTVQMTVDTAQLAFNAGNWNTPQTVNITAVPDDIDD